MIPRTISLALGRGGVDHSAPAPDEFDPSEHDMNPNDLECYGAPIPVDCPFSPDCPGDFTREGEGDAGMEWRCISCDRSFTLHPPTDE